MQPCGWVLTNLSFINLPPRHWPASPRATWFYTLSHSQLHFYIHLISLNFLAPVRPHWWLSHPWYHGHVSLHLCAPRCCSTSALTLLQKAQLSSLAARVWTTLWWLPKPTLRGEGCWEWDSLSLAPQSHFAFILVIPPSSNSPIRWLADLALWRKAIHATELHTGYLRHHKAHMVFQLLLCPVLPRSSLSHQPHLSPAFWRTYLTTEWPFLEPSF